MSIRSWVQTQMIYPSCTAISAPVWGATTPSSQYSASMWPRGGLRKKDPPRLMFERFTRRSGIIRKRGLVGVGLRSSTLPYIGHSLPAFGCCRTHSSRTLQHHACLPIVMLPVMTRTDWTTETVREPLQWNVFFVIVAMVMVVPHSNRNPSTAPDSFPTTLTVAALPTDPQNSIVTPVTAFVHFWFLSLLYCGSSWGKCSFWSY